MDDHDSLGQQDAKTMINAKNTNAYNQQAIMHNKPKANQECAPSQADN